MQFLLHAVLAFDVIQDQYFLMSFESQYATFY